MGRLAEKVALVTGAAQGIGEAIATVFYTEGAITVLTDIQDDKGRKVAARLGSRAYYEHMDVAQENEWCKVTDTVVKQFGRLDIIVNNAGISGTEPKMRSLMGTQDPEYATLPAWQAVTAVDLDGVFLGCKHAIRVMKETGGSIVNISSRSGMVGIPSTAAYAAAKAGVRNHTKTVALYCAQNKYPIRCNSVHPAAILTPMWDWMLDEDGDVRRQQIASIAAGIPLGKMGEPEDVAYAALFLASDEAKFITGAELLVDGGILAGSSATMASRSTSAQR